MRIVTATFVNNDVEPGWTFMKDGVPIGKRYRVDLDSVEVMTMTNRATGQSVRLECIFVLEPEPAGYLPLRALRVEPDA